MVFLGRHGRLCVMKQILTNFSLLLPLFFSFLGAVIGAPASPTIWPDSDDSSLVSGETTSLDLRSGKLTRHRPAHNIHSRDISYDPVLTISNWQPFDPSPKAIAGMVAAMQGFLAYLSNLGDDSLASGATLSLLYGNIRPTINIQNEPGKRQVEVWDHPPTPNEMLLKNLKAIMQGWVDGFFGFGKFIWDYRAYVVLIVSVTLLNGNPALLGDRAVRFGPEPNGYRPRYLVF
ncbi:MAG: hypothetical protein Q9191_007179 [Dirinaria sp. TL-2023a]